MVLAAGNKVWIPATGPEAEEDPYELAEVLDTNPLKCFTGEGEAGHFVTPKEDEVFLANSKTRRDSGGC